MIKNVRTKNALGGFYVFYIGSTQFESEGYKGVSHLVEHCMFEKIKQMESTLLKYGIYFNALTSNNEVVFYINGLDKKIQQVRENFLDSVLSYEITEDVFERERNIVLQELKQFEARIFNRAFSNHFRKYYDFCGEEGLISDIQNITFNKFKEFKNKYFNTPTFIGNVSKKDYVTNINFNDNKSILSIKRGDYSNFPVTKTVDFGDNDVIIMDSLYENCSPEENYYLYLFSEYLSSGLTSPLYKNVREKLGCVYSIWVSSFPLGNNTLFFISAQTQKQRVQEVVNETLETIKKEIEKPSKKRYGFISEQILNEKKISSELKYSDYYQFLPFYEKRNEFLLNKNYSFEGFSNFIKNQFKPMNIGVDSSCNN